MDTEPFAPAFSSPPSIAMRPRCGALADERRTVVAAEGGSVRTRNDLASVLVYCRGRRFPGGIPQPLDRACKGRIRAFSEWRVFRPEQACRIAPINETTVNLDL